MIVFAGRDGRWKYVVGILEPAPISTCPLKGAADVVNSLRWNLFPLLIDARWR